MIPITVPYMIILGIGSFRPISIPPDELELTIDVVILLLTPWNSFETRKFWRSKLSLEKYLKFRYKILFFFNYDDKILDANFKKLKAENDEHNDIIMPNVEDNYYNLGILVIGALSWLSKSKLSNLKAIVKINDDIIVDFQNLDIFLNSNQIKNTIACPVEHHVAAIRNSASKW